MAQRLSSPTILLILLSIALSPLVLTACGSDDGEAPPPTVASVAELATSQASAAGPTASQTPTASSPAPDPTTAEPSSTPPPVEPSVEPSDTPLPSRTPTPPPTVTSPPTLTPTPTLDAPALTQAAQELAIPITQTYEAIQMRQQTAAALASPTPSPTITPSPPPDATLPPSPTTAPPVDSFEIIFYSNRRGSEDIYLMTMDGSESRALTGGPGSEREPSCAPDGRAFVYASDADGSWQIYRQTFDSLTPEQLTDSAGLNFAPVYSPDGSTIAFVSTRNDNIPTIWLMDANGGNQRQLTTELGRDTTPNWGPDSRQLLFASDQNDQWDLFLTTVGTGLEGEFPVLMPEMSSGNQLYPIFDSNGERIAFTLWDDLTDPQTADIYLLDYELPEPVAVRDMPGADIVTGWADATHLLASVGGPNDVQIARVDITNGESVRLTEEGTFNSGARLCQVPKGSLPPEPTPAPSPTPPPSPTPAPTDTPTPEPSTNDLPPALVEAAGYAHVVQPGETLLRIGQNFGADWRLVAALNNLPNPDRLSIGQQLTIPITRTGYRQGGYQLPDSDLTGQIAARKHIVVQLDEQRIYAYEDGRVVRSVLVSTGLPGTPTVLGDYRIYVKREAQTMSGPGYYLPGVPYVMYFYEGYGIHGTYWHNNFGQPMSHGCVNLPTPEARWFYEWAEIGTPVTVNT